MDQTERKNERIRQAMAEGAERLRGALGRWIDEHSGPFTIDARGDQVRGLHVEVARSLLETAIDRLLALHGDTDARSVMLRAFERRAVVCRRSLQ